MSQGVDQNRHGIQVVKVSGKRYELDEEALKKVLLREDIRNLPVAVISVAGAFRAGKSFILDFFLRYLNAPRERQLSAAWLGSEDESLVGFDWRGGGESNTKGIHLWPEPAVVTLETGEKVAVLLMDTQGTFDMESDLGDNSTIFALSTLLSSVQIYNLRANIGEDNLHHLQLFTQYGQLASNAEGKAFQTLLFLVRDWSSPYEHPYGYDGGKGLLNVRFQPRRNQKQEVQEVREHIHACFESLKCFLMPHPGLKVTDINFKGRLCDIDTEFRKSLLELVPSLFDTKHLLSKTINGNKVSAQGLFEFFKQYANIFNSKELPKPTTIYQATVDASMKTILREARELYETKMKCKIVKDQNVLKSMIKEWHDAAVKDAVALFEKKKKLGSVDYIAARLTDLQKELASLLDPYIWQNDVKLKDAIANAKKAFETAVCNVCGEQARLCLHQNDLNAVYQVALSAGLALFDKTRTAVPKDEDTDREELVKNFTTLKKTMCTVNEQNNQKAVAAARDLYLSRMNSGLTVTDVSLEELRRRHEEALKAAINHFNSLRNRPTRESSDCYLDQVKQSSEEHFKQVKAVYEENERRRRAVIEAQEAQRKATEEAAARHQAQLEELKEQIARIRWQRGGHRNNCVIS